MNFGVQEFRVFDLGLLRLRSSQVDDSLILYDGL